MAKITGPLHSDTATGKFAKSMVFFAWKGINVCRQLVIPKNPQSAGQGDIRLLLGGLGRSVGKIVLDAAFDVKLKAKGVIPDQQSKQSYMVQYIKDSFLAGGGATLTGNYVAQQAIFTGATMYTAFNAAADTVGLAAFDVTYASVAEFEKGLGLYLIAKAAIALNFTGAPYSIALTSWTGAQVDQLVAHLGS